MSRSLFSATVLASLVACSLGAATGGAQENRKPPQSATAELRIREALDDTTVFEFIEAPLHDVVEFLKDSHQIPIEFDIKALDDAGLSTDVPITRNLKGVTLRSGLRILLRDLSLTFAIENETLVITTMHAAAARPANRVFSVANLLPADATGAESLAELIRATVSPTNEEVPGPAIATHGPLLIVRGTEEELDAVATLLWRMEDALQGNAVRPQAAKPTSRAGSDPFDGGDPFGGGVPAVDPLGRGAPTADPFGPAVPKK
jgi:hypothetical protein